MFKLWKGLNQLSKDISAFANHDFSFVQETGSTNDDLKKDWLAGHGKPRLLVAGHQTKGRGRLGRQWIDKLGSSLLFSFCWSWPAINTEQPVLPPSLIAGLAIYKACQRLNATNLTLKWPNDILINNRKMAGVLVESSHLNDSFRMVVGIGINLQPLPSIIFTDNKIPQSSTHNPISLAEIGIEVHPLNLLKDILEFWAALETHRYDPRLLEEFKNAAKGFLGLPHLLIQPDGTSIQGIPIGLEPGGALLFHCYEGGKAGKIIKVNDTYSLELL